MTTIIPYFDPILGKLRNSDIGFISLVSFADPFIINNLKVNSTASINLLNVNNGNFINLTASSLASFNTLLGNSAFLSTATIGNMGLVNLQWDLVNGNGTAEGQMSWDAVNQTVTLGMAGGNVDVALGLETLFPKRVRNSTGSTMPKGTAVYINGVSGNTVTIERAIATSDMTSAYTLGLTAESIADGATGWVTTFGELTGINLSAYTGGDTLYLSPASLGLFTNVKPIAPDHYVRLGTVVKATTDGILVVNVINGFETDELHDVQLSSLASGHILISNGSLWQNKSLATQIHQLNYKKYFGEYDEDPSIVGLKNGDEYWNTLDEKIQVYVNSWRELNGGKRIKTQAGLDLQFQNKAYLQEQFYD